MITREKAVTLACAAAKGHTVAIGTPFAQRGIGEWNVILFDGKPTHSLRVDMEDGAIVGVFIPRY